MRYCFVTRADHRFDANALKDGLDTKHQVELHFVDEFDWSLAINFDALLIPADIVSNLEPTVLSAAAAPVIGVADQNNDDQIQAFKSGVDDVVIWPVNQALLEIRTEMAISRLATLEKEKKATLPGQPITLGPLALDPVSHVFMIWGETVELTPKEYDLIKFLIERPGVCCTRDMILDSVWGFDFDTGTNMVDVYIYFLRKKLKQAGLGKVLQTVRGHGYRLQIEEGTNLKVHGSE